VPDEGTDVKFHVQNIVREGEVGFTKHARAEMADDDMSVADCMNLLRAGLVGAAEWENGEFRYRITTARMCIVIFVSVANAVDHRDGVEVSTMRKCYECGGEMTTDKNAVIRYDMAGLPHVQLHGVTIERCPKCGEETIVIPRLEQLHRALAHAFITQPRMIAPVEIKFLRKHMGFSSADFALRMGVARETVSRWEAGAQSMGAVADRLLRLLVITHEPTESYAVDDLLQELTDAPAPEKLKSVAMRNDNGWKQEGAKLMPAHR
jgi:putative zinc finger/helix-turn-helix YgiT family protein